MRYFIVFYIASSNEGQVTGMVDFTVIPFLNKKKLIEEIRLRNKPLTIRNIVLTGFTELTKEEHAIWIFEENN